MLISGFRSVNTIGHTILHFSKSYLQPHLRLAASVLCIYSKLNNLSALTHIYYIAIVTRDPFCWQKSEDYVKKYTFPRRRRKFTFTRNISETKLGSTIIWASEMDRMREEPAVNYITNRLSRFSCSVYKVLRNAALGLAVRSKAKKLFIFHVQRLVLRPQQKHRIFLL